MFTPSVRAMLVSKLAVLVADYVSKYPDAEIYDEAGKRVLINIGRTFIRQCNPAFVYYSKYLTPEVDAVVTTTPVLKSQPMTLKRVANAVQRGSDSSKRIKLNETVLVIILRGVYNNYVRITVFNQTVVSILQFLNK